MPEYMQASQSPRLNAFLIGASAGSLNGAVLNGMQVVKYRMWNLEGNPSFLAVARELYSESGTRIFFRGAGATALRDCVFGVVYESCRRTNTLKDLLDPYVLSAERRAQLFQGAAVAPSCRITRDDEASHSDGEREPIWKSTKCGTCAFISNLIAALLASIASSPFNYLRSVIYGAPSGSVPMRYASLLHSFLFQARFIYYRGESFTDGKSVGVGGGQPLPPAGKAYQQYRLSKEVERLRGKLTARAVRRSRHPMAAWRWVNSRLNIGWGSVRVGLGMAIGQSLFHMLQDILRGV
ncbi:mitochondrial carrier domain-containing protein [Trypanosoma grayi]|uniref:mitochondrial carrier domain-containing protein n=1 Tax=Trypanosoma grayi TaxID=71804 RepID=UPI0004F4708C|nr:mitochondrial carrier domain-containing protein [Trypanosoma grayi]KEG09554.1 mitochondrial carrier domain-containing protein [Trypanosoma grayi]